MTFVTEKPPPPGRATKTDRCMERHLYEAAVMLAVAQWMFESGAQEVCVYPDGVHAQYFDICGWLENEGFEKIAAIGEKPEAGTYMRDDQTLVVEFQPGRGDVVADVQDSRVVVEAKGGIVNTRHPGQKSKLRKHLYEAVGMLLAGPDSADRLIAAVPRHPETIKIATKLMKARRCRDAGIEIALVSEDGVVQLCAEDVRGGQVQKHIALKEAASRLDSLLVQAGVSEDEMLAEFRKLRSNQD